MCCTGRYNRIPVGKLVCMVLDSVIEYHSLSKFFLFFWRDFWYGARIVLSKAALCRVMCFLWGN